MAEYAFSFTYKPEAWARLIADPGDRTPAVRSTVEDAGGELKALYYTLGDLGGLAIVEAPDPETAAAIGLVITASGAFDDVSARQLTPASEFVPVLRRAQAAAPGYRRPGT
jgi:uncharacterized protein with GYD domain